MIKYDYHMHTYYSFDSHASLKDMADKAVELGLVEIAITDHIDFSYPDGDIISPLGPSVNVARLERLKEEYEGRLSILTGTEFGLRVCAASASQELADKYNFDIIIGSLHELDDMNLNNVFLYEGKTNEEIRNMYFEHMLKALKSTNAWDVVGHMDKIKKFGNFGPADASGEDPACVDAVLRYIIDQGKGLEVNTSGLSRKIGLYPSLNILSRYLEMGGEILTMGSDAHFPDNIAQGFDHTLKILRALGVKYITRYEKRKPYFVKI